MSEAIEKSELVELLVNYCEDVLNDKPLTCVKHKWACKRFLRDLSRQGTKEFPYEFIPENAERFFDWCNLFKHTRGILKGQYINLYDAPILLFIFGNIYGWYDITTGYRRFDKFYWQVARKNAKSQMLSLVASYELMAFDEEGDEINEVYCAATKAEQAQIVYNETKVMLNRCPEVQGYYSTANYRITHIKSDSFMRVLTDEDRKKGDGLNPQFVSIDEYHAHPTSEVYDVSEDGMGARPQPLLGTITTAGADLSVPCYRVEYKLVSKILDPNIDFELDNYFVMINELDKDDNGEINDDIKDPNVWIKANPIAATYPVGIARIKKKLKEALEAPDKMRNFLTKRMNVWVHLTELSYLSTIRWGKCKGSFPDLRKRSVYIGIDFANKNDLAGSAVEIPIDDKYYVMGQSFICEDTFDKKVKQGKVPYAMWKEQGWLTVHPGSLVDFIKAIDYWKELIKKYEWYVEAWCLDPWTASQIMKWLIDDGETVVEVRQGPRTLSEPTKDFRDMVLTERVVHEGDPLLTWAISNAIADSVDRNKNIILNKSKSSECIDPIAATINAHTRAMHAFAETEPSIFII